jgi:hypothetical protein
LAVVTSAPSLRVVTSISPLRMALAAFSIALSHFGSFVFAFASLTTCSNFALLICIAVLLVCVMSSLEMIVYPNKQYLKNIFAGVNKNILDSGAA